jgi:hypothetical protein
MRTNHEPNRGNKLGRIEIANADAFPLFGLIFFFCFSFFLSFFFGFVFFISGKAPTRQFMEGNGYPDRTTGGDVAIDSSDWADQWRTLILIVFNCFFMFFLFIYFFSY